MTALKTRNATIEALERSLGLSADEVEAIVATRSTNIDRAPLDQTALAQLIALNDRLSESFEPAGIPVWLRAGHRYLGGRSPLDMLTVGRFDAVEASLDALDAGIFI